MSRYLALFLPVVFILAAGLVCGLYNYRRIPRLRPVVILIGVTLASEILSYYMAKYYRNNMPLAHFFNPIQLCIWAVFFYRNIEGNRARKAILWSTACMLLFAVINTNFLQPLKTFPDNFIKLETILFILWGGYLFAQRLDSPGTQSIFKDSLFITAVAVIWFNLTAYLFFLLYAYMLKHQLPTRPLRTIHVFSNYIYYLILITAIVLPQKKLQDAGKV